MFSYTNSCLISNAFKTNAPKVQYSFIDSFFLQVVMYYIYLGIMTVVASFLRKYTSTVGLNVSKWIAET
jgi:hypothetical protein